MLTIEQFLKERTQWQEKQKLLMGIVYSANQIMRNLEHILRPYQLTASQYNLMLILERNHPQSLSVQQIAGRMLECSDVPRLVQRLEINGLVKANIREKGQRTKNVMLTQKGLDKLNLIAVNYMPEIEKPASMFTSEESTQFNLLIQKVLMPLTPREELLHKELDSLETKDHELTIPTLGEVGNTPLSNTIISENQNGKSVSVKSSVPLQRTEEHKKAS